MKAAIYSKLNHLKKVADYNKNLKIGMQEDQTGGLQLNL